VVKLRILFKETSGRQMKYEYRNWWNIITVKNQII